jgi:hypothetical protein
MQRTSLFLGILQVHVLHVSVHRCSLIIRKTQSEQNLLSCFDWFDHQMVLCQ